VLSDLKDWLGAHNAAVTTVLFVVFGVDLIAKGLPPLTTLASERAGAQLQLDRRSLGNPRSRHRGLIHDLVLGSGDGRSCDDRHLKLEVRQVSRGGHPVLADHRGNDNQGGSRRNRRRGRGALSPECRSNVRHNAAPLPITASEATTNAATESFLI